MTLIPKKVVLIIHKTITIVLIFIFFPILTQQKLYFAKNH